MIMWFIEQFKLAQTVRRIDICPAKKYALYLYIYISAKLTDNFESVSVIYRTVWILDNTGISPIIVRNKIL